MSWYARYLLDLLELGGKGGLTEHLLRECAVNIISPGVAPVHAGG